MNTPRFDKPCIIVVCSILVAAAALFVALQCIPCETITRAAARRRFLPIDKHYGFVESVVAFQMNYAYNETQGNDVVFLGDSTCAFGILPAQFTRSTGLSSYNLGVPGFVGLKGCQVLAETYLQHHPKPKLLVLCWHPTALGYVGLLVEKDKVAEMFRRNFLGLYGKELHLRTTPERMQILVECVCGGDQLLQRNGRNKNAPKSPITHVGFDFARQPLVSSVSDKAKGETAEFIHWLDQYDIPLLIQLPPVPYGARKVGVSDLTAWLNGLRNRKVSVGQPDVVEYDTAYFVKDGYHLNVEGAKVFTEKLAKDIPALLKQSR